MIGVFDSGLGGVLTATYIHEQLPSCDLFILADKAHAPYGEKDAERIRERTFTCLQWMFDQGCSLIILACNTASTTAICAWQDMYPEKKVLSVTIPGIEEVVEKNYHHIGIFATKISVITNLYPDMFSNHYPEYAVMIEQVVGEGLVQAIEEEDTKTIDRLVSLYASQFTDACDAIVLGCTHYPLIAHQLQKKLPHDLPLINPGAVAAKKLVTYLQRHPEILQQRPTCTGGGTVRILTTLVDEHFIHQCHLLRGQQKEIETSEV